MAERRSISSIHAYWKLIATTPETLGWYIETRNADGDVVYDSRQQDWDGPPPARYRQHDAPTLEAHLQMWEPEARVVMYPTA